MNRKILVVPLILLLLPVMIVPAMAVGPKTSEGKNPYVFVTIDPEFISTTLFHSTNGMPKIHIQWIDYTSQPIDPLDPSLGYYDMRMYMVWKPICVVDEIEGIAFISMSMAMSEQIYNTDGKNIGVVKVSMTYIGTTGPAYMDYGDGKLVITWTFNIKESLSGLIAPEYLKGQYVVWYDSGSYDHHVGFGTPMPSLEPLIPGYPFPP